jgi:hypothetical protein
MDWMEFLRAKISVRVVIFVGEFIHHTSHITHLIELRAIAEWLIGELSGEEIMGRERTNSRIGEVDGWLANGKIHR